mmetsp:Transcript_14853/g.49326  ORF Transcript_14853/g.49326 Transcript_14853/m.49326 type:complete len:384 (-) Transcript_14853:1120-2271(-)
MRLRGARRPVLRRQPAAARPDLRRLLPRHQRRRLPLHPRHARPAGARGAARRLRGARLAHGRLHARDVARPHLLRAHPSRGRRLRARGVRRDGAGGARQAPPPLRLLLRLLEPVRPDGQRVGAAGREDGPLLPRRTVAAVASRLRQPSAHPPPRPRVQRLCAAAGRTPRARPVRPRGQCRARDAAAQDLGRPLPPRRLLPAAAPRRDAHRCRRGAEHRAAAARVPRPHLGRGARLGDRPRVRLHAGAHQDEVGGDGPLPRLDRTGQPLHRTRQLAHHQRRRLHRHVRRRLLLLLRGSHVCGRRCLCAVRLHLPRADLRAGRRGRPAAARGRDGGGGRPAAAAVARGRRAVQQRSEACGLSVQLTHVDCGRTHTIGTFEFPCVR